MHMEAFLIFCHIHIKNSRRSLFTQTTFVEAPSLSKTLTYDRIQSADVHAQGRIRSGHRTRIWGIFIRNAQNYHFSENCSLYVCMEGILI